MVAATVVASAAEQTITIRDWTGRGFSPEVISYEVHSAGGVESGEQALQVVEWLWPAMPPVPPRAALR